MGNRRAGADATHSEAVDLVTRADSRATMTNGDVANDTGVVGVVGATEGNEGDLVAADRETFDLVLRRSAGRLTVGTGIDGGVP